MGSVEKLKSRTHDRSVGSSEHSSVTTVREHLEKIRSYRLYHSCFTALNITRQDRDESTAGSKDKVQIFLRETGETRELCAEMCRLCSKEDQAER